MHEFVVIADDFTGANDTGVQICKKGIPVRVLLDAAQVAGSEDSLVVDTESRVVSAQEAYDKVFGAVQAVMATGGCRYLYKKVDSTLRGHIREEVRAAIDAYEPETILFAPSYPAQGRWVQGKRLYVQGTALLDTEIAKDPRNPLQCDNIAELLEPCTGPVRHYAVSDLEQQAVGIGAGAYTFDAVSPDHLTYIARQAVDSGRRILWIGSAGLAEALLNVLYPPKPAVVAVVGSISGKTMEQIAYCRAQGMPVVRIDMAKAHQTGSIREEMAQAAALLKSGTDVVVTAAACRQDYEDFVAYGQQIGLSTDALAECTKRTLSEAVPQLLQEADAAGLFLTGGDTAIAVIQALQCAGSQIQQEILPGFVQGRLCGGPWDGMAVVTKAGAFGSKADIWACMQRLRML
ncbi:four-carbon acid sugar kinase family protein [Megasphaera stantonii]|uniref:four-carbon acid sugar kinase family protein n=1 Tax=Megasphaera stantonii TaxID=2144175 RepID=UPI0023F572F9|nr:four-carbon acid sugar kinase family protein [Megasphaera stantonii]